jgi:HlyD family secretion protein
MRKPAPYKITIGLAALCIVIASVVAFAYLWQPKQTLKLSGEVQAREIRNGSRFGGRVKRIFVQEGQTVQAGQMLVEFDDSDLQAKIADAKATLSQAMAQERMLAKGADLGQIRQSGAAVQQAQERLKLLSEGARPDELTQVQSKVQAAETQYKQAQQTVDNSKTMLDEGIISKQKYDSLVQTSDAAKSNLDATRAALHQAKSGGRPEERQIAQSQLLAAQAQYGQLLKGARPEEMSIASANVEKARSALQALEAQLGEVRIKALFPGYVSVLGVTPGELVAPGRPVITIIDYSHLWTDTYVPESKLLQLGLSPGEPVTVRTKAEKDKEFHGRIALINPKSEFIPNSGGDSSTEESTFRVKINIDNKDISGKQLLYPGMKVDIYFQK